MRLKSRKALYGARKGFYCHSGGQGLIVTQKDEIRMHLPYGSEIVTYLSEHDMRIRESRNDILCTLLCRLERKMSFPLMYSLIVRNNNP